MEENNIIVEVIEEVIEEVTEETEEIIIEDDLPFSVLETANTSIDINWVFREQSDYLDLNGISYYLTPDLELTLSENGYVIENDRITLDTDVSTCILLNDINDNLIVNNLYVQRLTFIGTTIQALLLIFIATPKLRELGRRLVGGKKGRGV